MADKSDKIMPRAKAVNLHSTHSNIASYVQRLTQLVVHSTPKHSTLAC
jgi:hypothetical protein